MKRSSGIALRPPWGRPVAEGGVPVDATADLVVVGAGAAGLTTALAAAEGGADVIVIEAGPIGADASGALPGWLTPLQGETPHDIRLLHGDDAVRAWAAQTGRALEYVRRRGAEFGVPVADRTFGATTTQGHWAFQLRFVARALRVGGYRCEFADVSGLPFEVRPELVVGGGAVVDPAEWLGALAARAVDAGVRIFGGAAMAGLRVDRTGARVIAGSAELRAGRVVLASSAPLADRAALRARVRAETWHLLALRTDVFPLREVQLVDRPGMLVSRYRDLLIIGQNGGSVAELIDRVSRSWPDAQVVNGWSTTTHRSVDGLPLVGSASLSGDTVLTAAGLGAFELVNGTAAGLQLADVALGRSAAAELPWRPARVPLARGLSKRGRSALIGPIPWITRLNEPGSR